jgi:hypothetical protein
MSLTAPIVKTEWFPATGDPGVIGRVVEIKRIKVKESKAQRKEVYATFPAIEHKIAGLAGDVSFAIVKEGIDDDNAEFWKRRFAKAWASYKGEANAVAEGTSLDEFDGLPDNKAMEFKLHGLTTVEQLAEMSDATCDGLGTGARAWRRSAQSFLKKRRNHGHGYAQQG